MDPVAEGAAGEVRVVENGVEAGGGLVLRIAVAGRVEERSLVANPVAVVGNFERAHLRVDVDRLAGQSVERVVTDDLIKRVAQVPAVDVSVARPAEVKRVDLVIAQLPERGGADEVAIAVVVRAAVVEVRVEAGLRGVAVPEGVLSIDVRDDHALVARVKGVQVGVGVLLAQVEGGEVVLKLVVVVVAEDACAEVHVVEDEAAKVAVENLVACARGHEVVVLRQVAEVDLGEVFLQGKVIARALGGVPGNAFADGRDAAEHVARVAGIVHAVGIAVGGAVVTVAEAARVRSQRGRLLHVHIVDVEDGL